MFAFKENDIPSLKPREEKKKKKILWQQIVKT